MTEITKRSMFPEIHYYYVVFKVLELRSTLLLDTVIRTFVYGKRTSLFFFFNKSNIDGSPLSSFEYNFTMDAHK